MESDLRRGHRDSELLGDLLVGQAVHVLEHHEHPQLGRQLLERARELGQQRRRLGRFLGLGVDAGLDRVVDGVERVGRDCGVDASPSVYAAFAVIRYSHVVNCASPRKRLEALPGSEVGLLHHVACVLLVGRESQRERVGVDVGPAHQFVERRSIPIAWRRGPAGRARRAPCGSSFVVISDSRGRRGVTDQYPGGQADRAPDGGADQRVSLWRVCRRSKRQYFFISIRSRSFVLFFIVM